MYSWRNFYYKAPQGQKFDPQSGQPIVHGANEPRRNEHENAADDCTTNASSATDAVQTGNSCANPSGRRWEWGSHGSTCRYEQLDGKRDESNFTVPCSHTRNILVKNDERGWWGQCTRFPLPLHEQITSPMALLGCDCS